MNNSRVPEIEHVMPQQHGYSLTGGLFNKYELGKLLGCGAFAKVYHARNISTGQSVAIKVINKKKITTASMMTNVKREISIMRRLNHQHIVKLHEVMATKSKIYFVMEFVKGGELFAKVAKGRFSEDLARKYFQQLISAVGYCHVRGVFHRDLKPENLLLDENGNLKVTDFGLSAFKDQIRPDGLLHTLCGTPAYVAPEILAKKGYDGAKIDVWSCGVILFVLTSGYLPFRDPNLMVMYKKIYKGEYRCPKWMSQDLRRFLARLLDTNPDTRITVDEVLLDPWFKKGCKEIKFYEDFYDIEAKDSCFKDVTLNAFDLISFSSGLDLSGLFDKSYNATEDAERVVAKSSPERLVGEMEEVMKREGLKVRKKGEWGLEIEGQKGNFVMEVDVYVLTEEFVVVEGRRRAGDGGCCWEIWREKVKPLVIGGCSSSSDSDSASSTSINVEEGSRIVIAAEN